MINLTNIYLIVSFLMSGEIELVKRSPNALLERSFTYVA